MSDTILALNAGSSSLKFKAFALDDLSVVLSGKVTGIGSNPRFKVTYPDETSFPMSQGGGHHGALTAVLEFIDRHDDDWHLRAIVHRVVHGGSRFRTPAIVDDACLAALEELVPLAPLHQQHNIDAIIASRALAPGAVDIACFDTAFHSGQDPLFTTFALPGRIRDQGIRRYGFHGISYEWLSRQLRIRRPDLADGRIVMAHLGNGASLCAMVGGKSVETSMGMTALDGLPMGTRCGAIDPGVVTELGRRGMGPEEIESILYNESGLKGLSGLTNDMAALLASDAPMARFAVDFFVMKVAQFTAQLTVAMGGLDAIVFSGGIGENAAAIRNDVTARLGFLPPFETLVIPTDEERMMAIDARDLLTEITTRSPGPCAA